MQFAVRSDPMWRAMLVVALRDALARVDAWLAKRGSGGASV